MKRFFGSIFVLVFAVMLVMAPTASAVPYTLTDGNSSLTVNPSSQTGSYDWIVNGGNVLYQQWFWYRIGNTAEQSIDTLTLDSATLNGANELLLDYSLAGTFELTIKYTLFGGGPNDSTADVAESIRINNIQTSGPLDFHFYQYSDFDLGAANIDTVLIAGDKKSVVQQGNNGRISETVVTPAPSRVEANTWPVTLGKLNDGVATNLNNVFSAGPGDVTWAFQWDKVINAGGSLIISKDKRASVPEPAALLMLGGCLLFIGRKLSKRISVTS